MTNFEALKNAESVEESGVIIEDYTLDFIINHGGVNIKEWLEREQSSKKRYTAKNAFELNESH